MLWYIYCCYNICKWLACLLTTLDNILTIVWLLSILMSVAFAHLDKQVVIFDFYKMYGSVNQRVHN